jgi:hypothetical protein
MRNVEVGLAACVVAVLSSCAAAQVQPAEAARKQRAAAGPPGYVGGMFSTSLGTGFGLVLEDDQGDRHEFQFGGRDEALEGRVGLKALPPGEYRLAAWQALNFGRQRDLETDVPPDHPLARRFTIEPGKVVFLAKFNARKKWRYSMKVRRSIDTWEIWPLALPIDEAVAAVRDARPDLATAEVSCVLCTAPRAEDAGEEP